MSSFEQWLAANGGSSAQQGGGSFDAWLAANGAPRQKAPNVLDAKEYEAQVKARALRDAPGVVSSLGVGFGKGLVQSGNELNRLVGHGLRSIGAGGLGGDWLVNNAEQMDRVSNDFAKPYKDVNPTTTGIGELGGNVAAAFLPMKAATKVMPFYEGLKTLGRIGYAAVQGAAGSVLNPTPNTQTNGDYWSQKGLDAVAGVLIGGGLSAMGYGVRGGYNNLKNTLAPVFKTDDYVGKGLVGILSKEDAAKAAQNIRSAPKYVEGSLPTTAQVAGLPALVQTEKAALNRPTLRTEFENRQSSNNRARWDGLNRVAGNELDLKNAIANRDTSVSALYNTAKQQAFPIDENISGLMNTPFMQTAISRAEKLAANNRSAGIFSSVQRDPVLIGSISGGYRSAPSSIEREMPSIGINSYNPFSGLTGNTPTQVRSVSIRSNPNSHEINQKELSGYGAHHIKMALDDMLGEQAVNGIRGAENRALRDVRDAYMTWLEGRSPEYLKARQTYRELSPQINGMQAAQGMVGDLGGTGRPLDSSGTLTTFTPQQYWGSLKRAKQGLDFGMHPNQENALEAIGKDLQRTTISNSIRTGGSDTAYNLAADGWLARNLYGPNFDGAPYLPKLVSQVTPMVSNRLEASLGNYLFNPEALLPYLDAKAGAGAFPAVGLKAPPNIPWMESLRQAASPGLLSLLGGQ